MPLVDMDLPEDLETIEDSAFDYCKHLRRITMPLKDDMIEDVSVFFDCLNLTSVDLVGGIHKTVASLHLESWRKINRINQTLPTIELLKTEAINGSDQSSIISITTKLNTTNY